MGHVMSDVRRAISAIYNSYDFLVRADSKQAKALELSLQGMDQLPAVQMVMNWIQQQQQQQQNSALFGNSALFSMGGDADAGEEEEGY